jgi:hypothetical protein
MGSIAWTTWFEPSVILKPVSKTMASKEKDGGPQPPSPTRSCPRMGNGVLPGFVSLQGFDCSDELSPRVEDCEKSRVCGRLYGLGGGELVPVYCLGEGYRSQTGD